MKVSLVMGVLIFVLSMVSLISVLLTRQLRQGQTIELIPDVTNVSVIVDRPYTFIYHMDNSEENVSFQWFIELNKYDEVGPEFTMTPSTGNETVAVRKFKGDSKAREDERIVHLHLDSAGSGVCHSTLKALVCSMCIIVEVLR